MFLMRAALRRWFARHYLLRDMLVDGAVTPRCASHDTALAADDAAAPALRALPH